MLDKFIVFDENKNPSSKYFESLSKTDRELLNKFEVYYNTKASVNRSKKAKANVVRFLSVIEKETADINLEDLQGFLKLLKETKLSDYFKNDVKNYVHRFLKWNFKDWSERFNEFEDISYDSEPERKNKITDKDILSKKQVETLIDKESKLYWKCFLVCQYQGALRTKEARELKWSDLETKDPEAYILKVKSKKNKKGKEKERFVPPLNYQAIHLLEELRKEQKKDKIETEYIFPSKLDPRKPISSSTANKWFSRLLKKVLNKKGTNYFLRHSRGEIFHEMIRENKMSEENATKMMGNSPKVFNKNYSHSNEKRFKELLKKQVLNINYITPEEENAYQKQLKQIKEDLYKKVELLTKQVDKLKSQSDEDLEKEITEEELDREYKALKKKVSRR